MIHFKINGINKKKSWWPNLEEVLSFDSASPTPSELHVDLALMQLAHEALTGTPVAVATTIFTVAPHHWL